MASAIIIKERIVGIQYGTEIALLTGVSGGRRSLKGTLANILVFGHLGASK